MKVIAPGIYQLPNGTYRVVARVGDRRTSRPVEKRFPPRTALKALYAWQADRRADLRRQSLKPVLGTLGADTGVYLGKAQVRALVSYKTRLSDTRSWLLQFGHMRRHELTTDMLQLQVDLWTKQGVAAWTVRHRINALRQLFIVLDGEDAPNPARNLQPPTKPRAIPRALDYDTIRTTFNHMEPGVTKAFLMVMAFCGFRPSEIKRTEPWMLHLDEPSPYVIRNTAKGGDVVPVPLSAEGVLAWQMFTQKGGFIKIPKRPRTFPSANRDWKAAMVRAGYVSTRCYDLVHSYCTKLLMDGGGDIAMVQKARGHRDIRTTLIYTQVTLDPRLAAAVIRAFQTGTRGKTPLR